MTDTDADWGRRYLASLPTSPLKPGDTATISVVMSGPQTVKVIEGDVIDGKVVRS